tara:strand:+ start:226 stop:537 length:312 start_codon:yes stop_codon:yes gene_type:complete
MMEGIEKMIEVAVEDYKNRFNREDMIERYENGFEVKTGRKYIKVINEGAAWAFVVNTDDDEMFEKGDILMAAGWATPARNQARGNVLKGDFTWIKWTGPEYLN